MNHAGRRSHDRRKGRVNVVEPPAFGANPVLPVLLGDAPCRVKPPLNPFGIDSGIFKRHL
jgi:hypothetical protein